MNETDIDAVLGLWGKRLFSATLRAPSRTGSHLPGRDGSAWSQELRGKLRTIFGGAPEVMVKVTGGGRGMAPIKAHLSYISRRGALALEDERGEKILGLEALRDLAEEWRFARSEIPSHSHRREALHIMLSMPCEIDAAAVLGAAREFAQGELARHKFAMVIHEPRSDPRSARPHVHLIVRKQGRDGQRLNPKKADLAHWRQAFADRLTERGIAASATRRLTRGELAGKRLWDDELQRFALQASGIAPNERTAATQTEVLQAWYELAGALSRSEDPQDRALALQTLQFVSQMPIVAQRQSLLREQGQAPLHTAIDVPHRSGDLREFAAIAQRQGPERTR